MIRKYNYQGKEYRYATNYSISKLANMYREDLIIAGHSKESVEKIEFDGFTRWMITMLYLVED